MKIDTNKPIVHFKDWAHLVPGEPAYLSGVLEHPNLSPAELSLNRHQVVTSCVRRIIVETSNSYYVVEAE